MALLLKTCLSNQMRRCGIKICHSKYTCIVNTKCPNSRIMPTTYFSATHFSTKNENISPQIVIYDGSLTRQVSRIKLFSLVTSMIGLMAQPTIYQKMANTSSIGTLAGISAFFTIFTIATPLLLHIVTKKYITQIVYFPKEDEYVATTYTLFLTKNKLTFKPEDVVVPEIPGMFTTCLIKKKPVFLTPESFYDLSHYKSIMGYDKPLDLKLEMSEDAISKKK